MDDKLTDSEGNTFSIINGVPRIAELDNYTDNFGVQWNKFSKTQLDRESGIFDFSQQRFFAETHWDSEDLTGKTILEVGSGAGRFSKVVLEHTHGILYSVDYSDAVTANFANNASIAPGRFYLFQASVYEMPFSDNSFDKVFCLGVLQHTPNFEMSVKSLIKKAKIGAEIVVDFYPIRNWYTKIHAKYILRPISKRMPHDQLLKIIDANIDWLIRGHFFLQKIGFGIFSRFLPIVDITNTFPKNLDYVQLREWAVLDTFDMFSPEHDHPQRINDVVTMFERNGAKVTFSGFEQYGPGLLVAVVRGIKE